MVSTRVRDLLEDAVERSGMSGQVLAARVIEETKTILKRTLGSDALQYVSPLTFKGGRLRLGFRTPVVGSEIRQHEARLLAELRTKFPRVRFERIELQPIA